MQTVIEYMKTTYDGSQLLFFELLGVALAAGLIVSFSLALAGSIRKFRTKKLSLEAEIAEIYLLISQLEDEEKDLPSDDNCTEEQLKAKEVLKRRKAAYNAKLNELLCGKDAINEAKKLAENNLKKKKKKIEKVIEKTENTEVKREYSSPQANFLDEETIGEVITIFADLDEAVSVGKRERADEKKTENELAQWEITFSNGIYTAKLRAEGKTLLSSSDYKSLSGVKSAITTIKNNLQENNVAETVTEKGEYTFKVFSASGRVIANGFSKELSCDCKNDILLAEKYCDAEIIER